MKTARIIATITIAGLAFFLVVFLPPRLIPRESVVSWAETSLAMFFAIFMGYGAVIYGLAALLGYHIWKSQS